MENKRPSEKKNVLFKVVLIISLALILIFAGGIAAISVMNRKPTAAFYGISERTQNAIVSNLQKTSTRKNGKSPFNIITLDDTISLAESLKSSGKIDILFIHDGLNAEHAYNFAEKKDFGFEKNILNGMSASIKKTVPTYPTKSRESSQESAEKTSAVPILSNHFEIDVKTSLFEESKIGFVNVISDIEKLSGYSKNSVRFPILFAAENDDELINVYGALTEALCGIEEWQNAAEKIKSAGSAEKHSEMSELSLLAENIVNEGEPFYKANALLKKWIENGFLPKNISQIKSRDIKAFAQEKETCVIFMTLEEHRTYEKNTISEYSSIYFPATKTDSPRHFTAPEIMAVPMSKNKVSREAIKLLSNDFQKNLAFETGLSPVQTQCSVPDSQADDARYWIAASEKPLPALSDAAFLNSEQKSAFAKKLRENFR